MMLEATKDPYIYIGAVKRVVCDSRHKNDYSSWLSQLTQVRYGYNAHSE